MGLFPPFPIVRHCGLGYGLDSTPDLGLGQLNGADPGWIMSATHVANFVCPQLKWRNPATNECRQKIIGLQALVVFKAEDERMNLVDLGIYLLLVKVPVELGRWADIECRQSDHVGGSCVLHIEERPEPLLA